FDEALAEEPRTVNRDRAEYLETLARYAQQLALKFVEELKSSELADSPNLAEAYQQLLEPAQTLAARTEERARRTWVHRHAWAAGDGRQLRQHHITGLRRLLETLGARRRGESQRLSSPWLSAEQAARNHQSLAHWQGRLDAVFAPNAWRELEHGNELTKEQDALLRELIAAVPVVDGNNLQATLHPPLRKELLAELGRRDPALAYRVAVHLWARDLALLSSTSGPLVEAARRWAAGSEWAAYAAIDAVAISENRWKGKALFVPARQARSLLLLVRDQLVLLDPAGAKIEHLATLGLRGAGLASVELDGAALPASKVGVDHERTRRIFGVLSSADLISIAAGMADQLCRRAVDHASSRVQFPGLFHDEEARDAIGKFGAIKKMIAEMEARRYLIDTLDHALSPVDLSTTSCERALLMKALTAEALGTSPGSLAYNAGQVFGGTGYSEDDILSKYYRDAAAWRFLGLSNSEILRSHGLALLRSWKPEAPRLASAPGETPLFDQVAQRKALQGELDEIRNLRSRLRGVCDQAVERRGDTLTDGKLPVEAAEALARQDAHLLACKALLFRTHARFEHAFDGEIETALLRVWLENVAVSLEKFDAAVQRWLEPLPPRDERPLVDPAAGPAVTVYRTYLDTEVKYDSGEFLRLPVELAQPRFVPELLVTDPELATADSKLREALTAYFSPPRGNNEKYERYVERKHRPDHADLDFLRKHGYFAYPIPKDLGGQAKSKAEYYLLTTNVHRLADVTLSLTIQVNSSLGSTPVLLGRANDLPRAQKELDAFLGDAALQRTVEHQVQDVVTLLERAAPDGKRIEAAYRKLHQLLQEKVLKSAVLRVVAGKFASAWGKAGRAGLDYNLAEMKAQLKKAALAWKEALVRAGEFKDELARRLEAADLFLRWVASGQISAFALTEPSAGSDTARVATRAKLRSVPVETEPDGVLHFVPHGSKEPRFLLDARKLEFAEGGVFYRWSQEHEPGAIHFDEYDYETDDPAKQRYYQHGSRRVYFSDVAQLRERDGQLVYDYWELSGAKMWITNGRMCGIMCLYAKTDEGVTGFIVDRHAEGMLVGKDEDKMGQCGSPTNELSLQSVRVPRENVIGLEGRGQVNALETLNVGRAGIAMSSMAQMKGLIDFSRTYARTVHGDIPDWIAWRLERMEEARFITESLAYETVGRFEHKKTKSVRIESAIAKMMGSELLHHVIELAEEIHDLDGQTQRHLVEKRKRDARVLNIYEGTNEIQRFFILKDLASFVGEGKKPDEARPAGVAREVLELESLKGRVRQQASAALALFGDELWQNPSLQANCFLLSEAIAWLKSADSVLARLAWLERYEHRDTLSEGGGQGPSDSSPQLLDPRTFDIGRRALQRTYAEVRDRSQRFDEELTHLRRGHYAPEVRAANLLFRNSAAELERRRTTPRGRPSAAPVATRAAEPGLRLLVILAPAPYAMPHLHLREGRLLEPHLTLSDGDRAALELALNLRDSLPQRVTIEVAAVGPRGATGVLRDVLSLGIERVRLLAPPEENVSIDSAAQALASVLKPSMPFDLIVGGAAPGDEESLLATLTAQYLGVPAAGSAASLALQEGAICLHADDGSKPRQRALPAAVTILPGLELRPFTIDGYLDGLARAVEIQRWPRKLPARAVKLSAAAQAASGPAEEAAQALAPREAARRLLGQLGLSGAHVSSQLPFEQGTDTVKLEDVAQPELAGRVVSVIACESDGRLPATAAAVVRAGRLVASSQASALTVLLVAGPSEEAQRRALGELIEWHRGDVVLLAIPLDDAAQEVRARLLADCWALLCPTDPKNRLGNVEPDPYTLVGEGWTEWAFAALACRDHTDLVALRVRRVSRDKFTGRVVLETSRVKNKLHVKQNLPDELDGWRWITLSPECEIEDTWSPEGRNLGRVQRWTPRLDRFLGRADIRRLLDELKQDTGLVRLADADFIVDVGFGVGNRDGYEAVIDPLVSALQQLGVKNVIVGGTRKVTEELHLLPADRQIGQSGTSVNPQILLAIGVSGAPQHLNYIGPRATILCFNRDPEAPLMMLNQRQPRPRVFPVVGNLFETVPALTAALLEEAAGETAGAATAQRS
ncbi:MAG: acyl-CoA dehydrogenase family protein, partial [Gemmataceae bacterium]